MEMSLNYKNILVAVDGSDQADKAFKTALQIAVENNATISIAHVIDTRSFATVAAYDQSIATKTDVYANELLDKYTEMATAVNVVKVNKIIEYGSPRAMIPKEIAKKANADLIVCGATGLNTMERFIIGSVSEGISRHAPCDVLIVRSESE